LTLTFVNYANLNFPVNKKHLLNCSRLASASCSASPGVNVVKLLLDFVADTYAEYDLECLYLTICFGLA